MDSLGEWINELKATSSLILVEGQKDKQALESLEIKNILTVAKTPLYKIMEKIQHHKEIIILTDLDREGRVWYSKIYHLCQQQGIKVNKSFREFLFKETDLTQIEGLHHYLCKAVYKASKMGTCVLKE